MPLTNKQKVFVSEYLTSWNATEAARRAGYKGDDNTLGSVGHENLLKPDISKAIRQQLNAKAMTADEVLMRLADIARGDLGDFADVRVLADLKDHARSRLVKRLNSDVHEARDGKIHYKINIELYDALAALIQLGKVHGLFTDRVDIQGGHTEQIKIVEVVRPPEPVTTEES